MVTKDSRNFCGKCGFNVKELQEERKAAYTEVLDAYHKEQAELTEQFWRDAHEAIGVPYDHPKAGKLRAMAWDHGHASGYNDVFYWMQDLAELVRTNG
jgi:plasmid stabilization system protein ParE